MTWSFINSLKIHILNESLLKQAKSLRRGSLESVGQDYSGNVLGVLYSVPELSCILNSWPACLLLSIHIFFHINCSKFAVDGWKSSKAEVRLILW